MGKFVCFSLTAAGKVDLALTAYLTEHGTGPRVGAQWGRNGM